MIARIAVGVALHGELAEGGLEHAVVAIAGHPQYLVIIALGHALASFTIRSLALRDATRASQDEAHSSGPGQADFLFFLSSSTSVNSASTTSSFLPPASPPGVPAPGPCGPAPACWAWYMASPSFMDAWASVWVFAWMASGSSPLAASFRSEIAFSIAVRSPAAILSPNSLSDFSVVWTSASAWFLASASARRFLSSAAWASASLPIFWMSASLRPPEVWMRVGYSLPVPLSLAWTFP